MPNLIAGLTTAAVVVPSALAYATLAGLPAEVGLYTALPALVLYALLGTSPVLSVSVTSTIAILTRPRSRASHPTVTPTPSGRRPPRSHCSLESSSSWPDFFASAV